MTYKITVNHTADNGPKIEEENIPTKKEARTLLGQLTSDWGYLDGKIVKGPDHVVYMGNGWACGAYIEKE